METYMNIYKLTQDQVVGYDTFDSAIVAAPNEDYAKSLHPTENDLDWGSDCWAKSPEDVKVELIGAALAHIKSGVILASYNAG